jgi:acyl dehydratase
MPVDPSYAGRTYPSTQPYEVGIEKIREFADAIGDPDPAYRDRDAARALGHPDVVAPPTFPFVLTFRASRVVVEDPDLGIDYSRVVHGEQKFAHHRPIVAGDRLVAVLTVDSIRSAGGHSMIVMRSEISTETGEPVCTATGTIVVRGGD